jgi:hypothetical protein
MFPPRSVYPKSSHHITVVFDRGDRRQLALLRAFRNAFGEHHSDTEALHSPRHVYVHFYPGGALEPVA